MINCCLKPGFSLWEFVWSIPFSFSRTYCSLWEVHSFITSIISNCIARFVQVTVKRRKYCIQVSLRHYFEIVFITFYYFRNAFMYFVTISDEGNQALQEFLSSRNPKQQHSSTLESYLIKPIQRILKYPLLLQQLRNLTDVNSDEHQHLVGKKHFLNWA